MTQDVDSARVEKIKQAMRNGELQMDADKIADALLRNILEEG
ncbi:MAG TPA: flagellar biosynthesis anti-sigma factor FlgM [Pantoea sp.]|nr:flagellar biosynthesis anti-sigma factor FlgM [Pantoea alvi]HCW98268.1 flagellar biosynthesis anti-sigma factor FlgM [Pantoea sp.]